MVLYFFNRVNICQIKTWIWGNDNATWNNIALSSNVKTVYDYEIGTNSKSNQQTDPEQIGLLYVSDYLYGASQENWNKQPYNNKYTYVADVKKDKYNTSIGKMNEGEIDTDFRSATDSNWLFLGVIEWSITQTFTSSAHYAFRIGATGTLNIVFSVNLGAVVVRPCFYLSSDTQIKDGTGTISDPYSLNIV